MRPATTAQRDGSWGAAKENVNLAVSHVWLASSRKTAARVAVMAS